LIKAVISGGHEDEKRGDLGWNKHGIRGKRGNGRYGFRKPPRDDTPTQNVIYQVPVSPLRGLMVFLVSILGVPLRSTPSYGMSPIPGFFNGLKPALQTEKERVTTN